jgi:hypothetical protein
MNQRPQELQLELDVNETPAGAVPADAPGVASGAAGSFTSSLEHRRVPERRVLIPPPRATTARRGESRRPRPAASRRPGGDRPARNSGRPAPPIGSSSRARAGARARPATTSSEPERSPTFCRRNGLAASPFPSGRELVTLPLSCLTPGYGPEGRAAPRSTVLPLRLAARPPACLTPPQSSNGSSCSRRGRRSSGSIGCVRC